MKKCLFTLVLGFATNAALANTITYSSGDVPGIDNSGVTWSFNKFGPDDGTLNILPDIRAGVFSVTKRRCFTHTKNRCSPDLI